MVKDKSKQISFNENYDRLKEIADLLKGQETPDIDQLLPLVEEATTAYKMCNKRLHAVKKALAEYTPEEFDVEQEKDLQ